MPDIEPTNAAARSNPVRARALRNQSLEMVNFSAKIDSRFRNDVMLQLRSEPTGQDALFATIAKNISPSRDQRILELEIPLV